jgi:hypothetical protein
MPTKDRWRAALELLLQRAGASKRGLERQGLLNPEQFLRWKKSPLGPSAQVLERLIYGIGLSWKDWAEVCEEAERLAQPAAEKKSASGGSRSGSMPTGKKGGAEHTYGQPPRPHGHRKAS